MRDIAASVLDRLKIRQGKAEETISCVFSFSVKKNFYESLRNQNTQRILYSKVAFSCIS